MHNEYIHKAIRIVFLITKKKKKKKKKSVVFIHYHFSHVRIYATPGVADVAKVDAFVLVSEAIDEIFWSGFRGDGQTIEVPHVGEVS